MNVFDRMRAKLLAARHVNGSDDVWLDRIETAIDVAADPAASSDGDKLRACAAHFEMDTRMLRAQGEETGTEMEDFLRDLADRLDREQTTGGTK